MSKGYDGMRHKGYIEKYLGGVSEIVKNISQTDISKVIDVFFECWKWGNTIYLIGNGGSASSATHFSCDLNKMTACDGRKRLRAISLVDNVALLTALVNDNGWEKVYTEQLMNHFRAGDVLCALSVHGGTGSDLAGSWSQNLLAAMIYAKEHGGKTVGIAGFDGGAFKRLADHCIVIPYNTTPHVESFHVTIHHLICFRLKEMIEKDEG
jgi:D-sedoheptulose 7-phosphate isomerase